MADRLAKVRERLCVLDRVHPCDGPVQAHHPTVGRGRGQKTPDDLAFPLCAKHHAEFHDARGYFRDWAKAERQEWQRSHLTSDNETF